MHTVFEASTGHRPAGSSPLAVEAPTSIADKTALAISTGPRPAGNSILMSTAYQRHINTNVNTFKTVDPKARPAPGPAVTSAGSLSEGPCIDKAELQDIAKIAGCTLTLDGCADDSGTHAVCPAFCSPSNSFLATDVAGKMVWLHPPYHAIQPFIQHYKQCKAKDPHNTGACIMVPKWAASWRTLLSGMQLLREYPAKTPIMHFKGAARGSTGDNIGISAEPQEPASPQGVPFPMQVYYDPPTTSCQEQLAGLTADSLTMLFQGKIAGAQAKVLCDSGATSCFINADTARRVGIAINPAQGGAVTLGDGSSMPVVGTCKLQLTLQAYHGRVECYAAKLAPQFDVILGDAWLTQHKAALDFGAKALILKKGTRRIKIQCNQYAAHKLKRKGADASLGLLSSLQVKRAVRQGAQVYLAMVQQVHDVPGPPDSPDPEGQEPMIHPEGLADPAALQELLAEYKDVFPPALPPGLPPERGGPGHTINLEPNSKPPFRPVYRLSPLELQEVKKQLAELLEKGYIEPSSSPFGAPVLFVQKKDGSLRMCVDYRALNKLTVKNRYPLPRIDDLFDALQGATCFSSLDLMSGYHQIRVAPADVEKTAFRTPIGHFQFRVLPFGLCNAPATFQTEMNRIFGDELGKSLLVYLDDILVFSKTPEEHLQHLRHVLTKLREHNFYAKMSKCEFNKPELAYLGHIVGREGIKPDPKKVAVVQAWPTPTTVSDLRQFLGLANYFRKFILAYAATARPLNDLLKEGTGYQWTDGCQEAFDLIKEKLATAPVLRVSDPALPYELISDASIVGTGAVLLQEGRPIAFTSAKLSPAERNYSTTEQEMLGVVRALQEWRCYLEGAQRFKVVTDHNPLTFFDSISLLSRRQARWQEFLSRFDFEWVFRPGRINVADPLSRAPHMANLGCLNALTRSAANEQAVESVTHRDFHQRLQAGYAADPWFQVPSNLEGLQQQGQHSLWYKGDALVIPDVPELRNECIAQVHDDPWAGHFGVTKTTKAAQQYYWWPGLARDVKAYVTTCASCQRNKPSNRKPGGLLRPLPVPGRRWDSVSLDLITHLPTTKAGNDAIVVFVDRLSKMVHAVPCKTSIDAPELARMLVDRVISKHGTPKELVSDRDPRFTSNFWREFCAGQSITMSMSSGAHPETDGQTERANRVLEEVLRHYVAPSQDNWDELLPMAEFAINNAWQESVQNTPFMLNFGQHPRTPATMHLELKVPAAADFTTGIEQAVQRAKQLLLAAQDRQKAHADRRREQVTYSVGDEVLLCTKNIKLQFNGTRKLLPRFIGPFKICKMINPVAFELELPTTMKRMHPVFHTSVLKPYKKGAREQPPPPPILMDEDGDPFYEVEDILKHRHSGRRRQYLVKWQGYGPEHNSWVLENDLTEEAFQAYWRKTERPRR